MVNQSLQSIEQLLNEKLAKMPIILYSLFTDT